MSDTIDQRDDRVLQHVTAGFIESQNERIKAYEQKIQDLEDRHNKSLLTRLAGSATTLALFLGVVLSISSVYNTFVTEPETVRIQKISQFNEAVSAAAKIAGDVQLFDLQNPDPRAQMQMMSYSNVQYVNDLSTAQAYLKDLEPADVGIPQIGVLFNGALYNGDYASAGQLVALALAKTDVTPYLRSEAQRYEGEYLFSTGDARGAHAAFLQAESLVNGPPRAYDLSDAANREFGGGDCSDAMDDFRSLAALFKSPSFPVMPREQMMATNNASLQSMQGGACSVADVQALFGN